MNALTIASLAQLLSEKGLLAGTTNVAPANADTLLCGSDSDSRVVEPGHLFVCKGAAFKPAYLASALEKGAVAYLCDAAHADELGAVAPGTPAFLAKDEHALRTAMALASAEAWGHPDRDLKIVGITGTKGKTTTSYMLRSIVDTALGKGSCSMIGTVETYDGSSDVPSANTTPESPDLWRHLANAKNAGLKHLVMEVSSQALKYDRSLGVGFDAGCFLNIGLDHISPREHADFEDYFSSKLKIFSQSDVAIVNLDSDKLDRILAAARAGTRHLITFGLDRPDADFWADEIRHSAEGTSFVLHAGARSLSARLPFPGDFNVSNALCAIASAQVVGISLEDAIAGLSTTVVPGRMEFLHTKDGRITSIVDFAHNRMAFESLFSAVSETLAGAYTIAVFGATGGKGVERRHDLPEVAARHVDKVILTTDDPWTEDPASICQEMERSLPEGFPHDVVLDREKAVDLAFREAAEHEGRSVVMLLGKGCERSQLMAEGPVACVTDSELAARSIAKLDAGA